MNDDMKLQLDRLLLLAEDRARNSVGDVTYAPPDCSKCHDTGMVENWYGWFTTPRGIKIQATQDRPVYSRCHDCNPKQDPSKTNRTKRGAY